MSTNVPPTIWQDTQGLNEYTGEGIDYVVSNTNVYLVDPSSTYIVDTGVVTTMIPATVWSEDDSI